MKYIRTKDRIYELESDYLNNKGVRVGYNVVGQEEVVLIENNSISQADTIEELCDLFMLEPIRKGLTPIPFKQLWRAKKTKNQIKLETTLYGAIWVKGKGLIYVAKMNSKGELELI